MQKILKDIRKGRLPWHEVLPFLLWLLKRRAEKIPTRAAVARQS